MQTIRTKILFTALLFSVVASSVIQAGTLWDAIINNNEAGVNKALESNININEQINKQEVVEISSTPLLLSIRHANPKIVELIAKKADVDNQEFGGYTPLTLAVAQDDLEKAEILIRHGADVNLQDRCGISPLLYSVRASNFRMLQLLFESNVDVNTRFWNDSSALTVAMGRGNPEIVKFLLDNKAHLNPQINSDFDALVYAKIRSKKSGNYSKILKLLNQSPVLEETDLRRFQENLRK